MTKENGFTLIELLAVIVILAIILLIATPIILNVIDDAKKGAFKNSANYLVSTAENEYMIRSLNNESLEELVYTYENGIVVGGVDLNYRGEKPKNGTIVIREDGKVGMAINNGTWCAKKQYNSDEVILTKLSETECILSDVPEVVNPFDEEKGVNRPVVSSGMTPIKWDENNVETETTENDPNWYDYNNKKWANARTADGSYWVWIPRYAYQITAGFHNSTTGTIEVKFLKERTNETIDETVIQTSGYEIGIRDTSNAYFKHPAFQFDGEQLGFWVAKFEPSGSVDNINIVPNVSSLRSMTIGEQFTATKNMKNNDKYGWSSATVDTHMMKNSEWGAVAYLSKSKYGANEEVWINPNSNYKTGCAGVNAISGSTTDCQEYNTGNGPKASTTHNITGIYDMNGGAYEYVAAYINNGHGNLQMYGSSLVNEVERYKNEYVRGSSDSDVSNYDANKSKYGNAVYETSTHGSGATSWYGDYSYMPTGTNIFFLRSGYHGRGSNSGLFYFSNNTGVGHDNFSFRPVIFVK